MGDFSRGDEIEVEVAPEGAGPSSSSGFADAHATALSRQDQSARHPSNRGICSLQPGIADPRLACDDVVCKIARIRWGRTSLGLERPLHVYIPGLCDAAPSHFHPGLWRPFQVARREEAVRPANAQMRIKTVLRSRRRQGGTPRPRYGPEIRHRAQGAVTRGSSQQAIKKSTRRISSTTV